MNTILKFGMTTVAIFALSACSTHTQLTSGNDYLSRSKVFSGDAFISSSPEIDAQIRSIAAVEPNLQFPARIGLARIDKGRLSNASADELMIWSDLAARLGPQTGEFVPVSPFIASMVRPQTYNAKRDNTVDDIRRASARQHLDYVLVYEITNVSDYESNALALADLTILGMFVVPGRNVKVDSTASAILLDVRNGYPYGTASAFADANSIATARAARDKRQNLSTRTDLKATENLSAKIETLFQDLRTELSAKR